MAERIFRIIGRVISRRTGGGVAGLRVEAWDKDLIFDDLVGNALSDAEGRFQIEFNEKHFKELIQRRPDLYFKLFQNDEQIPAGEIELEVTLPDGIRMSGRGDQIFWKLAPGETLVGIKLDLAAEGQIFTVRGRVVQPDGSPVGEAVVRAFDKRLGSEQKLGESGIDEQRGYLITYNSTLLGPERNRADLLVRVFSSENDELLMTSPLILNAGAEEIVNLVLGEETYLGPTEFAVISQTLTAELHGTTCADIAGADVAYLAGKTGFAPWIVAYYIKAQKLAQRTELEAEIFYGLFRQNLPSRLKALLSIDVDSLKRALDEAIRANIIKPADDVDTIVRKLREEIVQQAVSTEDTAPKPSLLKLTAAAGLSEDQEKAFLSAYVTNTKPLSALWQDLSAQDVFDEQSLQHLKLTLQLGAITLNHVPLIEALQSNHNIQQVRDLVNVSPGVWQSLVADETIGIPEGIIGETIEERRANYLRTINRIVETTFPTPVLARQLADDDDDLPGKSRLQQFFTDHPDFEFRSMKVRQYLHEYGVKDQELSRDLEAMQRIFCLTPRYEKYNIIKALWMNNIRSAHAIKRMGEHAFVQEYGSLMRNSADEGREVARTVFSNARVKAETSLMVLAKYGRAFNHFDIYVNNHYDWEWWEGPSADIPDLATLFGTQDYCDCKHCRSVLSPAAYLVDLLVFLDSAKLEDGQTALSKFLERRSDIGHIQLTCENTNTILPYIDLVNEILENAVHPPSGYSPQTELETAELQANPEHLNIDAYETLQNARYPWNLPFDLWAEEARVYLNHLGVPRVQVMETFRNAGDSDSPADIDIATEYLGMTTLEREIITGDDAANLWEYWGLDSAHDLNELQSVPKLLQQSHVTYDELTALLKAKFVNPNNKTILFPDDACSLESATLDFSHDELDKLSRFYRLRQKLGWTVIELDQALTALTSDNFDDIILGLADIKRLQAQLKSPLTNMLSWWSLIDTAEYDQQPSLYEQLFLNNTIYQPQTDDDPIKIFELDTIKNSTQKLLDEQNYPQYASYLTAVLQISIDDLVWLINEELPDDAPLNLETLSHLYRVVSFTRALHISLQEYASLKALTGQHPLTEMSPPRIASPRETLAFVETYNLVKDSGFNIETLDYLLRHTYSATSSLPPSEESIAIFLEELRRELRKTAAGNEDEDTRELLKNALGVLLEEAIVEEALAIIDGSSTKTVDEQKAWIEQYLSKFLNVEDAVAKLVEPGTQLDDQDERFTYVLAFLRGNYVTQKLATALGIALATAEDLLTTYVSNPADEAQQAIRVFTAEAFITSDPEQDITRDIFADQFNTYERLFKIALVLKTLNTRPQDIDFICAKGPVIGWLDLNKLPVPLSPDADVDYASTTFEVWTRLIKACQLQSRLFTGNISIFQLLEKAYDFNLEEDDSAAVKQDILVSLSESTGWNLADIEALVGGEGYDFQLPDSPHLHANDYANERWLGQLQAAFSIVKRLGVAAAQIWSWNSAEVSAAQARAIRNAAKAKYDNARWLEIAPPLRAALREKQRDALQSYLLAENDDFDNIDDLYEYYLVDTEMSACMMTSRIKQAISAVQLFVQRVLINLEAPQGIEFDSEIAREWKWRKNYRVWEANRKVFLYPENWIEPELRDDKTPFFKELENELLQEDISNETAERAFANYLEKLHAVSRLEVCGLYRDQEQRIVHVFGRIMGTHEYYYRRRLEDRSLWTPWEKVELDIEGEYLIPVVFNNTLFLFWPRVKEKIREILDEKIYKETHKRKFTSYEIDMVWSQYKNGKWSPKKASNDSITAEHYVCAPPYAWFASLKNYLNPSLYYQGCPPAFRPYINIEKGTITYTIVEFLEKDKFFFRGSVSENGLTVEVKAAVMEPESDRPLKYLTFPSFQLSFCNGKLKITGASEEEDFYIPTNCVPNNMKFAEKQGSNALELVGQKKNSPVSETKTTTVLHRTPGNFTLVYPHQEKKFYSRNPFFYEDDARTFYVVPRDYYVSDPDSDDDFVVEDDDPINYVYEWVNMWCNSKIWEQHYDEDLFYENPFQEDMQQWGPYWEHTFGQWGNFDHGVFKASEQLVPGMSCGYYSTKDAGHIIHTNAPTTNTVEEHTETTEPFPLVKATTRGVAMKSSSAAAYSAADVEAKSYLPAYAGNVQTTDVSSLYDGIDNVLHDASEGTAFFKTEQVWAGKQYTFYSFYHPYACLFLKQFQKHGIEGLLSPDSRGDEEEQSLVRQMAKEEYFGLTYLPDPKVRMLNFSIDYAGDDLGDSDDRHRIEIKVDNILAETLSKNFTQDQKCLLNASYEFYDKVVIKVYTTLSFMGYEREYEIGTIAINRDIVQSKLKRIHLIVKFPFKSYDIIFDVTYTVTGETDENKDTYPIENIDFSLGGAYSQYNWELFFHAPLLIATRLCQNQKFEEAQRWFHFIFDPTETEAEGISGNEFFRRFWKIKPFFHEYDKDYVRQQLREIFCHDEGAELANQIELWQDNPFQPHLIARYRIGAYMKSVVMKYLDNLIAWGDHLFRRDSIESLNEATQLYILTAQILGRRPLSIKGQEAAPRTAMEIVSDPDLDILSNALVEMETESSCHRRPGHTRVKKDHGASNLDTILYFCIPENRKILSYWDTVADRLFKIRHCMNIEGVVRQLPLFEPPIEPGLLVRAAAAGVDLGSALNDLHAPLPYYRFQYMLQKALEFCNDVKALGGALLAALEKRDAEQLALLRTGHELKLLKAVHYLKTQSIKEAEKSLESLYKSKEMAQMRFDHYANLKFMNPGEQLHLLLLMESSRLQIISQQMQAAAACAHRVPDFYIGGAGAFGSPLEFQCIAGGSKEGPGLQAFSSATGAFASYLNTIATMMSILSGYQRRAEDWKLQEDLAAKEQEQIDKQIAAARIRLAIAQKDLKNHELQTENAQEAEAFMKDKFTNRQLYDWMVKQISSMYFQSYQMAYDLAKRAEKAFQYERGDENTSFIEFGYWDNLKKGLLAGEQLFYDLKRMETAYLDQNKREYEITKHISLAMLDPVALINLKESGECFVSLPEALFDLDYPGHYMRRIKSVSLTIPCVTGPYTSVSCTLTLLGNRVRKETSTDEGYKYQGIEDRRFQHNIGAIQSIATSSAQNDSGVFELNFRDERYLPFEGAGVISEWRLELPKEFRQFDYDTISDVVFHINYTAREGGEALKTAAMEAMVDALRKTDLSRLFSMKHEFPNDFHRLLHPTGNEQTTTLNILPRHFPYMLREQILERKLQLTSVTVFLQPQEGKTIDTSGLTLSIKRNNAGSWTASHGDLQEATVNLTGDPIGAWEINAGVDGLDKDVLEDLFLLLKYTIQ